MKNKHFELSNIEVGTFKRLNERLTLKIDQSQFRYDSISELNEVKDETPNFLPLREIIEQDNHVLLTYGLSKEAKSLKHLPKEKKAIRTAIARTIMEELVINNNRYHVSLNPANIFYYPMSHVWYAYRANELMPFDDTFSDFVQYKALILYCLTGTPYERLLSNPKEALQKNKDDLIQQIVNVTDLNDLKLSIQGIDDYVSYTEWQAVALQEKKARRKLLITTSSIALVGLCAVGIVHQNDQNKYEAFATEQKAKIKQIKYDTELQSNLEDMDWGKANTVMDQADYSKEEKAQTFLKERQYQRAINADPSSLLKVVKKAYQNDEEKHILDWETPPEASETVKEQLKLEKSIINYDIDDLKGSLSFEENPDVLLRMGKAFTDNDDTQDAQTTQTKLVGIDEDKGKYLKALIALNSADKDVEDTQKDLDSANDIDDKDKSKDDKVTEAKSNLESAKQEQTIAQEKVDSLKKKVGE